MTIAPRASDVVIYHNPACGTSRNTLALIRNAGVEPPVIEYLKTPPVREQVVKLVERIGVPLKSILRESGTPFAELQLDRNGISDDEILAAIAEHPILINRLIVVTSWGVKLCRPSEVVLDILPLPQKGPFVKENGEAVIDAEGRRVK